MKKQRYFIRIKDGTLGGERGHIYKEATNVFLPDGFVAYTNEYSTMPDAIEVHPADELRVITADQYNRIAACVMEGVEAGHEIKAVMVAVEAEDKILDKVAEFKRVASELYSLWEPIPFASPVNQLLTDTYPFDKDFQEVLDEICRWGNRK